LNQRIVLATDSHEPSGVGEHMLILGAALAHDYDVVIAAPDHAAGRALLHRAAMAGLGVKTLDLAAPQAVRAWLASLGKALLHVHAGIGWEGHDLVRHGKAAGLAVVRTEHLPYLLTNPVQQAAYRAMLLSVDGRIAVSQAVYQSYKDQGSARLALVHNGVTHRAPTVARTQTRQALGLGGDDTLLLTVARLSPQKGHAVLIEAAGAVLERHPSARFVLVGTGPEQDTLSASIAQAGLEPHVIMLGQRTDVPNLLAAADLFVLPSLFEGLPLALLEAMAAKVPAIATTAGGSIEAIGRDHPFLAAPGDAVSLSEAIGAALDHPDVARAAADKAFSRHEEQFSAARMAADTATFYQSILHKQGTAGSNS